MQKYSIKKNFSELKWQKIKISKSKKHVKAVFLDLGHFTTKTAETLGYDSANRFHLKSFNNIQNGG
jgi:hypothetical protein